MDGYATAMAKFSTVMIKFSTVMEMDTSSIAMFLRKEEKIQSGELSSLFDHNTNKNNLIQAMA